MSKRKRGCEAEIGETTPSTSLQCHPLSFLIPKQFAVPFSVPTNVDIPSDVLVFSQDDVNDFTNQSLPIPLLDSDIWNSEDPDLKFVKFKKPYVHNESFETANDVNLTSIPESEFNSKYHLENILPVTKNDYFVQNLTVQHSNLLTNIDDDNTLLEEISTLVNKNVINEEKEQDSSVVGNSIATSEIIQVKPEFSYDSSIPQTQLISQSQEDFIRTVLNIYSSPQAELQNGNNYNLDNNDKDFWDTYSIIFPYEANIVRPDILNSLKSKLLELISTDSCVQVELHVYSKLLEICMDILKESLSIEWGTEFESENIFNSNEYQKFAEVVMQCCSIIILLHANELVEKVGKHENSVSQTIDFICLFGTVLGSLFTRDHFVELPGFFVPTAKQYSTLLSILSANLKKLALDESSVTRLEYTSFSTIFKDIISNKERLDLNLALEDIRAEFSDLIISIYSTFEDQRIFIFNEIIDNFTTLSPLKSKAKNYRLACGVSIQLISYLIVSLFQCHNEYGKDFDFSQFEFLTINHSTKAKKIELQEITDNFWGSVNHQFNSLSKAIDSFMASFLHKIISCYSPSLRKIVENIFADFLVMLDISVFPVCSIMLSSLLTHLLHICSTTENTQNGESALFFEIIGMIGSKLLFLKNTSDFAILDSQIKLEDFKLISEAYITFLSHLKFGTSEMSQNKFMFDFLSMIYLKRLKWIETELNTLITNEKEKLLQKKLEHDTMLLKAVDSEIMKVMSMKSRSKSEINIELTTVELQKCYQTILKSQDLLSRYNNILNFILSQLNHPKAKGRTLAVKNLTLLIDREPELLQDQTLRHMIKRRLTESYTSVTDAVLDLLYKVLESKPEYIEEYSDLISQKMKDSSLSVKRKTAHLIKFMFHNTKIIKTKIKLSQTLLTQLDDDEERISDLACHILSEVLFVDLGSFISHNTAIDAVSVQNKAYEIIYILCGIFSFGPVTWNLFERFFEEKVIYASDFNKSFKSELKLSTNTLVESMLELITDSLEDHKEEGNVTSEYIMGIMCTFVKCNEKLISQDRLITIQPYIINDYKGSNICFYALQILNLALNHQNNLNKSFVQSCKESLMQRLTKFNSKELESAIQCLWKLFLIDDNTKSVSNACISSLRMLLKYIAELQKSIRDFKPDSVLPRLLYLIGGFGRYCKFERDRDLFISARIGLLENEPISVFLLKYLLKFCDSSIQKPVRKIAIKNALNICISHPKLFFSVPVSKLIESTFKKKDLVISNIVIGALLTFLEDEEIKMAKKNGLDAKRSGSVKLDIAVFHGYTLDYVNDGLCSTLVQKYMHNILEICLEKESENAMNSINFLKIVIKFGFCNPKLCFPTVVALECAKSNYIKHIALELHRFLFEKFETLIESTYSDAIKATVKYITKIYEPGEFLSCSNFLKLFFRIIIERKSKQRVEKFLQAILRALGKFNLYKFQKMSKNELILAQNQVIFLCININELEFDSQKDLLKIITSIEKFILSEESIFADQFNLLMDLFEGDDDDEEKLRYSTMAKILLAFNCLAKCLIANYSISPDIILKYQEGIDKKEFKNHVVKVENNRFFQGEIRNLLTGNAANQLTLLHNELQNFVKN